MSATMKQVDSMLPVDEAELKVAAQEYATAEGNISEKKRHIARCAQKAWQAMGRKNGASYVEKICHQSGIRRIIDETVQRRWIAYDYVADKNTAIQTLSENKADRITDRVVNVDKKGNCSWNTILTDDGKTGTDSKVSAETLFTGTPEKEFRNVFVDKIDETLPTKGTLQKKRQDELYARQNNLLLDFGNVFSEKTGIIKHTHEEVKIALKTALAKQSKDTVETLAKMMLEVAKEMADKPTPTLPMPTDASPVQEPAKAVA